MSNKSEQVKIYQKSSGGVILKNGAVMPSTHIARELNGMKEQIRKLTLKNRALQSMNEGLGADIATMLVGGRKSTRSTLPDGVTRVVNAATGEKVQVTRWPVIGRHYVVSFNGTVQHETYEFDQGDDGMGGGEYFWNREDLDECPAFNPEADRWIEVSEALINPTPPASAEPAGYVTTDFLSGQFSLGYIARTVGKETHFKTPVYLAPPAITEGLDKELFPHPTSSHKESGWSINYEFIESVQQHALAIYGEHSTQEEVQAVLLAFRDIKQGENK